MTGESFIFDSRCEYHKRPFGAASDKTSLSLSLKISRRLCASFAEAVFKSAKTGDIRKYQMSFYASESGYDVFSACLPPLEKGLYCYWFEAAGRIIGRGEDGRARVFDVLPLPWLQTIFSDDFKTPDWIKGGIFYHIFVDRFASAGEPYFRGDAVPRSDRRGTPEYRPNDKGEVLNNDFFGGNLKGIIEKLPYLHSLGVSCLYLSPIFKAYSNHKYDTGDFLKIDPAFGSEEDFKSLCSKAREFGIGVICDGVFSHVGSDSIYFNRYGSYESLGAWQSAESPYYPWFRFLCYPDKYDCWWGIETLPNVNECEPSYLEFITGESGVVRHWIAAGASGWRLDVADELPDEFIEALRRAAKAENPEALVLGEVWEDASCKTAYGVLKGYLWGGQLDSVMNYPFRRAIIDFVRHSNADSFVSIVENILENYPPQVVHCLMNILGTHDTERILTALAGEDLSHASKDVQAVTFMTQAERSRGKRLLKMAALLQMTLPGVPCVYYGDEAGMEGYRDPFNRRFFPWGEEDGELLEFYRRIMLVRRNDPVFIDGAYKTHEASGGLLVFSRKNDRGEILIAANRAHEAKSLYFDRPCFELLMEKEIPAGEFLLFPDCFILAKKT